MKKIEDIEKLSIEQLEASAESIELDATDIQDSASILNQKIETSLAIQCAADKNSELHTKEASWKEWMKNLFSLQSKKVWVLSMSACCVVALLVTLGIRNTSPQDTFTDPVLAYAELERSFEKINSKLLPEIKNAHEKSSTILTKSVNSLTLNSNKHKVQ